MRVRFSAVFVLAVFASACGSDEVLDPPVSLNCSIPEDQIVSGGPGIDGIPALDNPTFVSGGDEAAAYLREDDRVIGLLIGGEALAVPLNILWWHEIVNLDVGDLQLAVTHCPLTGSSLVFDRSAIASVTLGVSGLLFRNNLLMYDRNDPFSLWPQMLRGARCGPRTGSALPMFPSFEMTWAAWRALHPATTVVGEETGFSRDYQLYPYGSYDREDNAGLLFPIAIDGRRPPKERVLGIPDASGAGVGLPFGGLDALGAVAVVALDLDGEPVVVFWDRASRTAAAFEARLGNETLAFEAGTAGIVDDGGSTWRVDGLATEGPRAGTRLVPVAESFIAYWFAWAAFYPDAELWTEGP
jgi:hypothetical protein